MEPTTRRRMVKRPRLRRKSSMNVEWGTCM
jgi:hypothetical protein